MGKDREDKRPTIVCPICGETYQGIPAVSRADNQTLICEDCGIRQALSGIGVSPVEQEQILSIIHDAKHEP